MLTREAQGVAARRLRGPALREALCDSRLRLRAAVDDLSDAQWRPPPQRGVNPVAWELMHVAWFAVFWLLRGPHRFDEQDRPQPAWGPWATLPDARYDSSRLPHAQRWTIELPPRQQVWQQLDAQLQACLEMVPDAGAGDAAHELARLVLFHEDMHVEALWWMRAALGFPAPAGAELPVLTDSGRVRMDEGRWTLGVGEAGAGFAFDNEQPAHDVWLAAHDIDRRPVSNADFLTFVQDGGYRDERLWPQQSQAWRVGTGAQHPARWRSTDEGWQQRWFDRWLPLPLAEPVVHVNAWEARAFCAWAGRALPSAAQWERAAVCGHLVWGSVWEWTRDVFGPYPGFQPGPYRDYSRPWFGDHCELRGGAFATHARMRHPRYRNFFQPWRSDVFAGFRTVSS